MNAEMVAKLEAIRRRLEAERAVAVSSPARTYIPCRTYADDWRNQSQDSLTMPQIDGGHHEG